MIEAHQGVVTSLEFNNRGDRLATASVKVREHTYVLCSRVAVYVHLYIWPRWAANVFCYYTRVDVYVNQYKSPHLHECSLQKKSVPKLIPLLRVLEPHNRLLFFFSFFYSFFSFPFAKIYFRALFSAFLRLLPARSCLSCAVALPATPRSPQCASA